MLDQAIQNNWDNLKTALAQRLQQPDSTQTAINVLLTMRQHLDDPVSKFAVKIMKLVRKVYLAPTFTDAQHTEIAKNHFLKGMLPMIADSFATVDPAITFDNALARAHRVEAQKNLLQPNISVKPVSKVAITVLPAVSFSSLLGLPPAAALQASSKLPDENAKALIEMKDALQTLRQELREWKTAASNTAQTNRNQNFQSRGRGFGIQN